MIGLFVEDLQNKLIAFIAKLTRIMFLPVPRLTLENIEYKRVDKLMSIDLYKYNISEHLNQVRSINEIDKYRTKCSYQNLYANVYTMLIDTKYDTVKFNILYDICEDILKILDIIKKYKSYNDGIKIKSLDTALNELKHRYNNVRVIKAESNAISNKDLFAIVTYTNLEPSVKTLVINIKTMSELLNNTVSNSLSEQTMVLIKLYKNYEDTESRVEIERQLELISNFLKEQVELNELPGSRKYVNNKLGISSHYIQSVIDNNNWVE